LDINWNEIREKEFPSLNKIISLKAAGGSPMSRSAYNTGVRYFDYNTEQVISGLNHVLKFVTSTFFRDRLRFS
jgi:hypothetical protein